MSAATSQKVHIAQKKPIKMEHDGAFREEWVESFKRGPKGSGAKSVDKRRPLGAAVSTEDLLSVVFSLYTVFDVAGKETVVVPRSRGGFVYATVIDRVITTKCPFKSEEEHPSIRYLVAYPGGFVASKDPRSRGQQVQQQLTKYLPAYFIGKLPREVPPDCARTAAEMDRATQGLTSVQIERMPRSIGGKVLQSDLATACFSPESTFEAGQIVAVPRSFGGFTYGRVLGPHETRCITGRAEKTYAHEIDGWRVAMEERSPENPHLIYKDLPAAVVGRLFIQKSTLKAPAPAQLVIKRPQDQLQESILRQQEQQRKELEEEEEEPHEQEKPAQERRKYIYPKEKEFDEDDVDDDDNFYRYIMKVDRANAGNDDDNTVNHGTEVTETAVVPVAAKPAQPPQQSLPSPPPPPPPSSPPPQQKTVGVTTRSSSPQRGKGTKLINVSRQTYAKATEPQSSNEKMLVVIDAPNVGRHDDKMVLKVRLLKSAIDYYVLRGFDVVAFLPRYFMEKRPATEKNPTIETYAEMNELVKDGTVSLTPPQDYDDSYCIEYARKHKGVIVTNDMYRDHIEKHRSQDKSVGHWIRTHCISYTFVRGEFIPNPDFEWDKV